MLAAQLVVFSLFKKKGKKAAVRREGLQSRLCFCLAQAVASALAY